MSWISGLAGKAEDILNKIDQNAANVLQQPVRNENDKVENVPRKSEESIVDGLKRNLSSTSLTLSRTLSPKKYINSKMDEQSSAKSDKFGTNISSRRSSISSRADGTVVEQEIPQDISLNHIMSLKPLDFNPQKEIASLKIMLAEVTAERDELQSEIASYQEEIKNQTDAKRIQEMEDYIETLKSEKHDLEKMATQIEHCNLEYVKTISELESNLAKSRQNCLRLTEKVDWQSKEAEQAVLELTLYRKKAQAALQIKEKVIEELKNPLHKESPVDNSNDKVLNIENESLRQENLNLIDELKNVSLQLDNSKEYIQKLEGQIEDKNYEISKMQDSFKENVRTEQQRNHQLESEIKLINQEIAAIRDESNRQRQSYTARLHEKDSEINRLRTKSESVTITDVNNMEDRMQFLTQALVQKQASIETVTADRNALRLQLEKVEDQLQHMILQQRQQRVQIINVNDTDDAKAQLPYILRENPFDTNVARKVKRAYSSLDSAGIRIGVFLRRYPLIRIMVFMYIALLHLWVMFVLLSSTPS